MMSRERGLTRRQFGTGLVSLVAAAAVASRAKSEASLPTIDTHAHVFHRGLKLAPGRRYAPDYDAPLALYLEQLDRNGMSNGVLVQPSFLGTDNSYLVESLRTAGGRLRGIAVVDPSVTADELRALDRAGVVGIRLNLVGQPLPDLSASEWKALLANLKALGWQVEIQRNAADLAVLAPRLLDHGVTVVLDHYALPDPRLGLADPGFRSVLKLGATKNVWVKISAPYRNGAAGESFAKETYPLLRSAYGLDRLLWGSDWPHTQFEASQGYERNRQFLDTLITDPAERAQVLASPRSLFRF
ncbi:amidohydrolase family protein [Bradyrhizobium japonicum]|jgi:predicted TIM-barrel fold metal-dependent hydrolase|uniref:amidohydrolase family protein n=1 Tax=Bradyrhizobium japonicum TaxID=375 RepID=UPI0020A070BC|nr:amidohydrolase family protein [Bradyrhizobium japonicum]MCP1764817.1 putative TIM-barrel fold metal-dependent hydrolase [Bradyrhizobium japonicum]MCP1786954.1 putative TIM-barrel fold metal-dependent hydrolase [Bradyrhizobium japonicum]MCP1808831.1 putative TIM-barrel fold metal-dependent hydrolase [Bradyrhizobium japonicum]MCP1817759.1 putative TIM-barrel fold metal-dependent hydrolase [Bradyrhizobium japonicum]MCP1870728.1 putative TIM-barrel fold metal-dependent hydrolase [Bradyrhizobium